MKAPYIVALAVLGSIAVALLPAMTWPQDRVVASFATSLQGRNTAQRHNAELALHRLDGAQIRPGETFSFNQRVGTYSRDAGYRRAPVSYDGQLVNDWGGGVCQTSTTLYNAAMLAGMDVLERHHHAFAPGYVEPGRDAAVAFSNIDLRFKNPYAFPVRLSARLEGDCLLIQFRSEHALPLQPKLVSTIREIRPYRTYSIGAETGNRRIRTSGEPGCEVVVTRVEGSRRETMSHDLYPAMNRVVDTQD